jgi:hypothetical protein
MRGIDLALFVRLGVFAVLGATVGCFKTTTVYSEVPCVIGTVSLPDTIALGDSLVALVSGLAPGGDCCDYQGINVSRTNNTWELYPVARCRQPLDDCMPSSGPFEESVKLPPLDVDRVYVRVQFQGIVVIDSVIVHGS